MIIKWLKLEIATSANDFGVTLYLDFLIYFSAFTNKMVDALVTPESVAIMLNGEKPPIKKSEKTNQSESNSKERNVETSLSYEGFN